MSSSEIEIEMCNWIHKWIQFSIPHNTAYVLLLSYTVVELTYQMFRLKPFSSQRPDIRCSSVCHRCDEGWLRKLHEFCEFRNSCLSSARCASSIVLPAPLENSFNGTTTQARCLRRPCIQVLRHLTRSPGPYHGCDSRATHFCLGLARLQRQTLRQ
jgi:hypothetical protein